MVMTSSKSVESFDFEPITVASSDFEDGNDDGASLTAGEIGEVAIAEIGEDGQLSSYDIVRLGDSLDPTGNSAKGKMFADLRDTADSAVDDRTEMRYVVRPKNGNRRTALTNWYSHNDLNQSRPDHRIPLSPVTVGGNPAYAKDGRVLAVEIRNDATSVTVDRTNSQFKVPARGGY